LGRFLQPDPLYLEFRRLSDPQQLNLYSYTRNNPLRFTDPTGLDVALECKEQSDCDDRVEEFNDREGAEFQVQLDENNVMQIVGQVNREDLKSDAEIALYDAIKDQENHVTLEVVKNDDLTHFDSFAGGGKNKLDASDLNKLSQKDKPLAGHVISHAILEAHSSLTLKTDDYNTVHAAASKHFEGTRDSRGPISSAGTFTYRMEARGLNKAIVATVAAPAVPDPFHPNRGTITKVAVEDLPPILRKRE
jgi:hypothetical protein